MLPHPAHDGGEGAFPPRPLMPRAQVSAEVLRRRRAAHEHRQTEVTAALVQETIDEARLLLRAELRAPQLVEIASFENAPRRKPAARQRVADAESEEVILKSGGFADEARAVRRRLPLQMKVHVRVAGAALGRNLESMQSLRGLERMIEVVVDLLEVGDDRAAERGDAVEDEEIRIAAGREVMVEDDVDPLRIIGSPRHLF